MTVKNASWIATNVAMALKMMEDTVARHNIAKRICEEEGLVYTAEDFEKKPRVIVPREKKTSDKRGVPFGDATEFEIVDFCKNIAEGRKEPRMGTESHYKTFEDFQKKFGIDNVLVDTHWFDEEIKPEGRNAAQHSDVSHMWYKPDIGNHL